jgi:hypothetical protein
MLNTVSAVIKSESLKGLAAIHKDGRTIVLSVDAVKLPKPLCRLCKDITESKGKRVADQYV